MGILLPVLPFFLPFLFRSRVNKGQEKLAEETSSVNTKEIFADVTVRARAKLTLKLSVVVFLPEKFLVQICSFVRFSAF
jgi:hypothetical protein